MQKEKGITLVEVLISLLILIIGIFAVLTMHTTSVRNNKVARELTEAMHIANRTMECIIATDINETSILNDCLDNNLQQNLNPSSPQYGIEADPSFDNAAGDDLFTFKLIITWNSFGEERELILPYKKSSVGMRQSLNID